jgi:hypothetical protein
MAFIAALFTLVRKIKSRGQRTFSLSLPVRLRQYEPQQKQFVCPLK